jgi:hypothetical protein
MAQLSYMEKICANAQKLSLRLRILHSARSLKTTCGQSEKAI